jgi:hypothetical protein
VGVGVQLGPLGTAATNRPIVPAPGDYDDGGSGGMMIGRGNWSTRRKPAPVPLCPPQTLLAAQTRTRAAAVGSQWLTAWAMAQPDWITYWWDSLVDMTSVDLYWFTSLISVQHTYITQSWISTTYICQYQFIRVLRLEFYFHFRVMVLCCDRLVINIWEKIAVSAFTLLFLCLESKTLRLSEILTFQFSLTWFHNPKTEIRGLTNLCGNIKTLILNSVIPIFGTWGGLLMRVLTYLAIWKWLYNISLVADFM